MAGRVKNSLGRETRSYTYSESGMPRRLEDASASVGNISLDLASGTQDTILYDTEIEVARADNHIKGIVSEVNTSPSGTSLSLVNPTSLFNVETTVLPFVGTFTDAIDYYLDLIGLTITTDIEASIASRSVVIPGWYGNVWSRLKQFFAVQDVEVVYKVSTAGAESLVVRLPDTRELTWAGTDPISVTVGNTKPSSSITVKTYGNQHVTQGEIYAPDEGGIISVDANETVVTEVTLDATVISVNQPVCMDWVNNRSYENTNGVYAVAGSDGLSVKTAEWLDKGGELFVEMTEDPSIMRITVKGADIADKAPFRIAMTSGEYYNALHVTGEAVLRNEQAVVLHTGASPRLAGSDDGPVIDNIFVDNDDIAYRVGQRDAGHYSGLLPTASFQVGGINQGWGDITGSLFNHGYLRYRVTQYTETNRMGSIEAEVDVKSSDFDAVWSAINPSSSAFDAYWVAGTTSKDFSLQALRLGNAP